MVHFKPMILVLGLGVSSTKLKLVRPQSNSNNSAIVTSRAAQAAVEQAAVEKQIKICDEFRDGQFGTVQSAHPYKERF